MTPEIPLSRDRASPDEILAAAYREADVAMRLFGAPKPDGFAMLERMMAWLQLTPLPREADRDAFGDDAWRETEGLVRLIATGKRLSELRHRASNRFTEAGLSADFTAIRRHIANKGQDLFRFADPNYRDSIDRLKRYTKDTLPQGREALLKQIDLALALQKAEADFRLIEPLGRAFGRTWRGADSDWERLDNIRRWRLSHASLPPFVWAKLALLSDAALAEADRARQALYAALKAYRLATAEEVKG